MQEPRRKLVQYIGRALARVVGWTVHLPEPLPARCVIVGAPHTSGWDLAVLFLAIMAADLQVHWIGKDDLFPGPIGWLLKRLGGIPVNRHQRTDMVRRMVDEFERRSEFQLIICPEGTRRKAAGWKTGFYYIALNARVPIVLGYPDYARRVVGFDTIIRASGDIQSDMQLIQAFYSQITGKNSRQQGEIQLIGPSPHPADG